MQDLSFKRTFIAENDRLPAIRLLLIPQVLSRTNHAHEYQVKILKLFYPILFCFIPFKQLKLLSHTSLNTSVCSLPFVAFHKSL